MPKKDVSQLPIQIIKKRGIKKHENCNDDQQL